MSIKNNQTFRKFRFNALNLCSLLLLAAAGVKAQMPSVPVPSPVEEAKENFTWWYILLFVLALGLCGAIAWVMKNKKDAAQVGGKTKTGDKKNSNNGSRGGNNSWETKSLDADRELEWFRKNQKLVGKNTVKPSTRNSAPVKKSGAVNQSASVSNEAAANAQSENAEKSLPVFSIERLELARPFVPLPLSNDEVLMDAIEQTHDEFEEDEEVRDLSLRILAAFKTRNSVEALTQMALYDLSAGLRSKAVSVLSDFNHETVFEPILQASADPTREVRAAAARSISKLTFDRADAWSRIAETGEEGRMRQSARAAVESGFVEMSFDRLAHPDRKYSYEAFALMVLLVKSGETDVLFQALETHKNKNVRRAVLHVLKISEDAPALERLAALIERKTLPAELLEDAEKAIEANALAVV